MWGRLGWLLLWNGERFDYFKPGRGVRQEDSISPYLFVLCIARLSNIICEAVREERWKSIKLSRSGPFLSHLFFADDMVHFAKASTEQTRVVLQCLERFCGFSGQKVNVVESNLFVFKNVDENLAQRLSSVSDIPLTEDLGKYLGVPSIHGRFTIDLFASVVERVATRLEGWKTKYLSLAGRKVLAQSILSAILLYFMQSTLLSKGICDSIEKLIRKFIWGGKDRNCHLVNWKTILLPKERGGLGLRNLYHMNLAFLAKVGWRMLHEEDSLWVQMLRGKYVWSELELDKFMNRDAASNI